MIAILFSTFVLLTIFLWGWALVDLSRTKFRSPYSKLFWLLFILLFPTLGSIVYFQLSHKLLGREKRQFSLKG